MTRTLRIVLWLLIVNAAWTGQAAAADPESEATRELELRLPLSPATRLFVQTSLSRKNFSSSKETSLGLAVDRKIAPSWSYRVGLRQIGISEDEDESTERRAIVDLAYQRPLGQKWRFGNRNRADLRWMESKPFSYRLRDRLMLERSASVGGHEITWYVSYELYFDSRYDAISRGRGITGVSVAVNPTAAVEIYASSSRDWVPSDRQTNTVGLLLTFSFAKPTPPANPPASSE